MIYLNTVELKEISSSQTRETSRCQQPRTADIAAWHDSKPTVKDAISSAGMTSQEYTTFLFSMVHGGYARDWRSSKVWRKCLRVHAPRENVEYYLANRDKLAKLGKEPEQLSSPTKK